MSHSAKQSSQSVNKKCRQSKAKVSLARQSALKTLKQVFSGQSLSAVQARTVDSLKDKRDRGLANEIVNGVLRWRWQLEFFTSQLLAKALKKKDIDVQLILLMALYELKECRTPDYAIINDAVELSRKVGKKWASGLVNAVLRRFTREKEALIESMKDGQAIYSHPRWILEKVKADWPENWKQILDANNQRPAFWLRVNEKQYQCEDYQKLLTENDIESQFSAFPNKAVASALKLSQGLDVRTLPGFSAGAVSVQDVGAQLTAELLDVSKIKQVLDLCAAPGGKTCHLLERYDEIEKVIAVEIEESRMARVSENLQRLRLESRAELIVSDASEYREWWSGEKFERILIDAPCSASGVIRRHPDIKTLRRESDITPLVELQAGILNAAWQMLAPGGELLYVTCSVFKDENQNQIQTFLSQNTNATETKIDADWGQVCEYGRQLLPGEFDADGFYYCRLKKLSAEK